MRIILNNGKSRYLHLEVPEPTVADGADLHYTHVQVVPSAVWTVTHNLGKKPAVSIVTSAGDEIEGEVSYTSLNQVVLTFAGGFSGEAYLN